MIDFLLTTVLPIFMYAETHYRFPGWPSRLFRRVPEILADVPHRVRRGEPLPIAIIVKDSHRFPLEIDSVEVQIDGVANTFSVNHAIQQPLWHTLLYLSMPDHLAGRVAVNVIIHARCNGKLLLVANDNFPTASHQPFSLFIDTQPLPGADHCLWGDLHCHSEFTDDQVEFGPPLPVLTAMAKAVGLNVVGITDHSYDLDDLADDYLHNDPQLGKWHDMQAAVRRLSESSGIHLIAGEELSVGNSRDQNMHMLIFNDPTFYEGAGDSGERAFNCRPRHRLADLLPRLAPQAAVFAAHPEARPPLAQRLILKREKWSSAEYGLHGLHGLQIWNGEGASGFEEGIRVWVRELLQGRRLALLGGNDSHGDFNRVRHVKIPFWSVLESRHHIFGQVRTGLYLERTAGIREILAAMRMGQSCISNGPFALLRVDGFLPGSVVTTWPAKIEILLATSVAFGPITQARLLMGDVATAQEQARLLPIPALSYHIEQAVAVERLPAKGYLRLEVVSETGKEKFRCLTNPVYLDS